MERGRPLHGRVQEPGDAPADGEETVELARGHGFTVEQILSGRLAAAVDYRQDHDEWCLVLAGGAVLDVDDVTHTLSPGDWLLLPAHVPHRLVRTEPNTSWLVVRASHDAGSDAP